MVATISSLFTFVIGVGSYLSSPSLRRAHFHVCGIPETWTRAIMVDHSRPTTVAAFTERESALKISCRPE